MMRRLLFFCLLLWILLPVIPVFGQDSADTDALESLLDDYASASDPAVVLYVSMGDLEWVGARGLANIDTGESAQSDNLFRIGSTTKPMVATLMLQLVGEGLIGLDDPIADYLPQDIVSNVENAESATVRQILQMTSGIFDYTESDAFNEAVDNNSSHFWTAQEVISYAEGEAAYFAPGDAYYYSNSNFVLAQLIIEALTGESLEVNLRERVFDPLGMDHCYLETAANFGQGIVRGYEYGPNDDFIDVTEVNDGVGLGDGGVVCSAADLAKFPRGLVDSLLSDDLRAEMFATVDDGEGGQYGLGIGYDESEFGTQISHDGATSGFQSGMTYLPDSDLVVVVLTNNFNSELVDDLTYDVQALVFDES